MTLIEERVVLHPEAKTRMGDGTTRFSNRLSLLARTYDSDIEIIHGENTTDVKRLLTTVVVISKVRPGNEVLIRAEGEDAREAVDSLAGMIGEGRSR